MNHRNGVKRLGRDKAQRVAILNNLALSLFKHEKIKTTKLKAKLLKSFAEKIITRTKVDTLHNRRLVYRNIKDTKVIKKLFEDIGKRFQTRKGGYTRIYNIGQRKGDGASVCTIELVEELLSPQVRPENRETAASTDNEKTIDSGYEPKAKTEDNIAAATSEPDREESLDAGEKKVDTESEVPSEAKPTA